MFDRQLLGDVALAAAIAIPSVALARPQAVPHHETAAPAPSQASTVALASAADRQIGLFR